MFTTCTLQPENEMKSEMYKLNRCSQLYFISYLPQILKVQLKMLNDQLKDT